MNVLASLAALLLVAGHPAQANSDEATVDERAQSAVPKDMARWAIRILDDYPRRAAQRGLYGRVRVFVIVQANGRVADCRVIESSGQDILDEAACAGMVEHARFEPTPDADGNAVLPYYAMYIEYRQRR
ncbi:energy transducer TonB [Alteriqipengyuania sp. WL0013]|uniref:energy transducer TonB n=1 Tax=Alteriqipengyuania sp. WL0013 TaxID=3110773 RepID=UPI002CA65106|nr:energy transducer TonB [Alteriqipengyuania sp. WL0013]MEB3415903.1 energy transducer TonB [Alteriqipengyuania sp. WL0013]